MNKLDVTNVSIIICCSAIYNNLVCKIAGQQNTLRSLLRKLNDEVLTTSNACKYLILQLKLFLHIRTPI